ncbi:hypothetical protein [Streptomyces sp.]|uniref:hypothetical protein n=1 Tax=Streptomyces sp. TaxID=1931 RepID=UPI002F3E4A51
MPEPLSAASRPSGEPAGAAVSAYRATRSTVTSPARQSTKGVLVAEERESTVELEVRAAVGDAGAAYGAAARTYRRAR